MGLLAAETGEWAKGRDLVLSDLRGDSMLAAMVTDMTAVSQVTALPHPPPALICDRDKICSSLGATAINATITFVTVVTPSSPLEMSLLPKYYFCSVSQYCSSCTILRLLFLLTVFWTSSSYGHLSPFTVWGCVICSTKYRMRQSLWLFKHRYTGETVVLS